MTERVKQIIGKVQAFIAEKDDAMSMPVAAQRFVHGLVLATGAQRCVEIGTSYGHSALWIGTAVAVNSGTLVTIDLEPRKTEIAAGFFNEAGLGGVIECRTGPAADVLSDVPPPIEWVLNDADKENLRQYVEKIYPKMPVGGMIVTDNVTSHEVVRDEFSAWIRQDERFASALADVGNGLEISVKVA